MLDIQPIGIIQSPFREVSNMPIQPKGASGIPGRVLVDEQYADGLKDLEGFSHIYLIYHFHKVSSTRLSVIPFMDKTPRGVFSTRTPMRPNHIGISIVRLVGIERNILTVDGIDVLDQTPLLDIKPYIEAFDHPHGSTSGWMTATEEEVRLKRSDERFI